MSRRCKIITAALAAALIAVALLSMTSGEYPLSFKEIFTALFSNSADPVSTAVVRELRLPRMLLALLCGASLGIAGAILQSVLRNDLASPDIIGISGGGGTAGLLIMLFLPEHQFLAPPAIFAGALATAALIYFAAWKRGIAPGRLILAGVAINAITGAASGTLLLLNSHRLVGVFDFTLGSFANRGVEDLRLFLPCFIILFAGALLLPSRLDILSLGDETAASVGLNVERFRLGAIALAAVGCAGVAGVAGLIGFAGLIAPHCVRILGRSSRNNYMLPASALAGALLMLTGDWAGRAVAAGSGREIPAGVFLSFAGAVFFLFLLLSSKRSEL